MRLVVFAVLPDVRGEVGEPWKWTKQGRILGRASKKARKTKTFVVYPTVSYVLSMKAKRAPGRQCHQSYNRNSRWEGILFFPPPSFFFFFIT